ncbi:GNAT family N-acetyltransferase [Oscillospiraceae bacterium WX1]
MDAIKPGRWHHYKGNDYEVLYIARHSETLEPMVVYRALYGDGDVWVRPASMWQEMVLSGGAHVPRFTYTGDSTITLRRETPDDYMACEHLTREAFWNLFKPGCDEHYLLHVMRRDASFIPELDIVAEKDGAIAGHIAYTKSCVAAPHGGTLETITFGPLSVLPPLQRSGIGARLVLQTLADARRAGYGAVIILGHPKYYPTFGFRCGRDFGLTLPDGTSPDALLALELQEGFLTRFGGGVYQYADVYHIDTSSAEAFDRDFPYKEKKVTETQL